MTICRHLNRNSASILLIRSWLKDLDWIFRAKTAINPSDCWKIVPDILSAPCFFLIRMIIQELILYVTERISMRYSIEEPLIIFRFLMHIIRLKVYSISFTGRNLSKGKPVKSITEYQSTPIERRFSMRWFIGTGHAEIQISSSGCSITGWRSHLQADYLRV